MVNIDKYLNDGANWQAQAVLAYIRGNVTNALNETWDREAGDYLAKINVGRYENCREQGYVFELYYKTHVKYYAVYEHRNSDSIIVLMMTNRICLNTPNVNDMWSDKGENPSKHDYDKAFNWSKVCECGEWILDDMYKTIQRWDEDDQDRE